jgi:hypothetical protein
MSLRPEVFGFDIEKLRSIRGCKDQAVLNQLLVEFDKRIHFRDESLTALAKEALRRAIFEGLPFPDLEKENEAHVCAAVVLAEHDQELLPTGSNTWKMPTMWELVRVVHERLELPARRYLLVFYRGRPVFGRRIKTDWSYYGFLTLRQLGDLLVALENVDRSVLSTAETEWVIPLFDDLLEWLRTIQDARRDLWFYAY